MSLMEILTFGILLIDLIALVYRIAKNIASKKPPVPCKDRRLMQVDQTPFQIIRVS